MRQLKNHQDFKESLNQTIHLCPKTFSMKPHKDKIINVDENKYYYKVGNKQYECNIETALTNFNIFVLDEDETTLHSMETTKSNNMTLNQSLDTYVFKKLHLDYELHSAKSRSFLQYRKEFNEVCQRYPQFFSCDPKSYIFWDDERISKMSEGEKLLALECRQELINFFKKSKVLIWESNQEG